MFAFIFLQITCIHGIISLITLKKKNLRVIKSKKRSWNWKTILSVKMFDISKNYANCNSQRCIRIISCCLSPYSQSQPGLRSRLIPPALLSPTFHLNYSGLPPTRLSHLLHQAYGIKYLLPFAHPTQFILLKRHTNHICIPVVFLMLAKLYCLFIVYSYTPHTLCVCCRLLSRILSIINSDWLQHTLCVCCSQSELIRG